MEVVRITANTSLVANTIYMIVKPPPALGMMVMTRSLWKRFGVVISNLSELNTWMDGGGCTYMQPTGLSDFLFLCREHGTSAAGLTEQRAACGKGVQK